MIVDEKKKLTLTKFIVNTYLKLKNFVFRGEVKKALINGAELAVYSIKW